MACGRNRGLCGWGWDRGAWCERSALGLNKSRVNRSSDHAMQLLFKLAGVEGKECERNEGNKTADAEWWTGTKCCQDIVREELMERVKRNCFFIEKRAELQSFACRAHSMLCNAAQVVLLQHDAESIRAGTVLSDDDRDLQQKRSLTEDIAVCADWQALPGIRHS